jgi:hypothetical protein
MTGYIAALTPLRDLTPQQVTAMRRIMQLFVEDDLDHGVPVSLSLYCHACERGRPAPGFIRYGHYQFCNGCATEFEVASARQEVRSVGEYMRDRRFGEAERHRLSETTPA